MLSKIIEFKKLNNLKEIIQLEHLEMMKLK